MRIEIDISDELPEAKALKLRSDLNSYVLNLIRLDLEGHPNGGESEPDYATIFREAQHCTSAFKTREEADAYIEHIRNEWHEFGRREIASV